MSEGAEEYIRRQLTPFGRAAAWFIKNSLKIVDGYSMPFTEDLVAHYGPKDAFNFLVGIDIAIKRLTAEFGPGHAQLLIGFSAMMTGCEYCAVGHTYGANAFYFKATRRLLPYSERDVGHMMGLDDDELRAFIEERVQGPDVAVARDLLLRMWDIRMEVAEDKHEADTLLRDLVAVWNFMNECSIMSRGPAYPTCRMAKDKALLAEYNATRDQQEAGTFTPLAGPAQTDW